jgi:glutamine amidotransferase-like uncharacterized protein
MKSIALIFNLLLVNLACAEVTFQVPKLVGGWKAGAKFPPEATMWSATEQVPAAPGALAVPVAGAGCYLFCQRQDSASLKFTTRVYFAPQPDAFALNASNPEALHLVAEFPSRITRIVQAGDNWWLVRATPTGKESSALAWEALTVPEPASNLAGKLRVALYDDTGSAGKGVPRCVAQLARAPHLELTRLTREDVRAGLSGYHVVIFSGGSGSRQAGALGLTGREQVRRFVEAGGGYVGICAGAYLACDGYPWGVHLLDARTPKVSSDRGRGALKVEATQLGKESLQLPIRSRIVYHNGPVLLPGGNPAIPDFETLAYYRSEVSRVPEQAGLQINAPAMVRSTYGKGKVLVSSPHPEQTDGLETWVEQAVRAVAP